MNYLQDLANSVSLAYEQMNQGFNPIHDMSYNIPLYFLYFWYSQYDMPIIDDFDTINDRYSNILNLEINP